MVAIIVVIPAVAEFPYCSPKGLVGAWLLSVEGTPAQVDPYISSSRRPDSSSESLMMPTDKNLGWFSALIFVVLLLGEARRTGVQRPYSTVRYQ